MISLIKLTQNVIEILNKTTLPTNPAIIFDIDDTLIDRRGAPIIPIIYLYNVIAENGISTMIVTAREASQESINQTWEQLNFWGISKPTLIYFRPSGVRDVWRYKESARFNVLERGFNIVMSIGDEDWDIGKYSGIGVKVPK